eukprot:4663274-Pyramimonas_sp.AAC.2
MPVSFPFQEQSAVATARIMTRERRGYSHAVRASCKIYSSMLCSPLPCEFARYPACVTSKQGLGLSTDMLLPRIIRGRVEFSSYYTVSLRA